MDLQDTFYTVAIIYMGLMILLLVGLVIVALVIKSKINKMQRAIEAKVEQAKNIAGKASMGANLFRYFFKNNR
jgi:hypothetical protein